MTLPSESWFSLRTSPPQSPQIVVRCPVCRERVTPGTPHRHQPERVPSGTGWQRLAEWLADPEIVHVELHREGGSETEFHAEPAAEPGQKPTVAARRRGFGKQVWQAWRRDHPARADVTPEAIRLA
jgi:hypothetical protein